MNIILYFNLDLWLKNYWFFWVEIDMHIRKRVGYFLTRAGTQGKVELFSISVRRNKIKIECMRALYLLRYILRRLCLEMYSRMIGMMCSSTFETLFRHWALFPWKNCPWQHSQQLKSCLLVQDIGSLQHIIYHVFLILFSMENPQVSYPKSWISW